MSSLVYKIRAFCGKEDGTSTVEFAMLFPALFMIFIIGAESGLYAFRTVMLERAVDISIRDVRLGNTGNTPGQPPDLAALKSRICAEASIIPDCMQTVQIEMQPIDIVPGSINLVSGQPNCRDMSNANQQDATYDTGVANSMMMVRVCAMTDPMFAVSGLGAGMKVDRNGNYALVATTAFVNEPGERERIVNGDNPNGGISG